MRIRFRIARWVYVTINRWRYRLGSVVVDCPTCAVESNIEDLEDCVCGAVCCSGCVTHGEDIELCPACLRDAIADHAANREVA